MQFIKKIKKRLLRRCSSEVDYERFRGAINLTIPVDRNPIILDVGAHQGETVSLFKKILPSASIYSFEPFLDSYKVLEKNTSSFEDVKIYNYGLADFDGESKFNNNVGSPTNSLLELDSAASTTWNNDGLAPLQKVTCNFLKLDSFLSKENIDQIDLLKIDVQGAEFKVLEGSKIAFSNKKIKAIFMEIIIGPTYTGQLSLEKYLNLLDSYGFDLKGMYNLTYDENGAVIQLDALFTIKKS